MSLSSFKFCSTIWPLSNCNSAFSLESISVSSGNSTTTFPFIPCSLATLFTISVAILEILAVNNLFRYSEYFLASSLAPAIAPELFPISLCLGMLVWIDKIVPAPFMYCSGSTPLEVSTDFNSSSLPITARVEEFISCSIWDIPRLESPSAFCLEVE